MKKLLALAAISLSIGLPLALNAPTTAHAAKWHQGTPKVLRGTWERNKRAGQGKYAFNAKLGVKITKKGLNSYWIGDPLVLGKMKYRKTSQHVYVLKGIEMINSLKPYQVRIRRVGNRLKYQEYQLIKGHGHYTKATAWLPKK
ncbi:hypothetical protein ACFQ44_05510 [Levilactobacillus lanxiensis]|uniref:Uncharacterized protein n=1 Tax=Levilactobacillus lanxiensis TaxID=2799568 RepID=A0ABW4D3J7_9LACO|nr:hypothetical protein [Levilactobacillus lanxiensis]